MPLVSPARACGRSRTWPRTACLPTIRLALSAPFTDAAAGGEREPPRAQRPARRARPRSPTRPRARRRSLRGRPGAHRGRNTIRTAGGPVGGRRARPAGAAQGSRSPPARPRGRRDHAVARRPPRTSARAPSRPAPRACARAAPASASSQRQQPLGDRLDGAVVDAGRTASAAACAGTPRGERLADLRQARVGRADRQRPAGGGLGGDHPEGLGEGARHDQRLARGQQLGELLVLEAAGEHDPLAAAPRRPPGSARARSPARPSRNASRWRSGARARRPPPSSAAARPARSPARRSRSPSPQSAARSRSRPSR